MTRTLFCLSMPGGHMSYIATLAACLLGRLKPNDLYITPKGSSHGANLHFPVELYKLPNAYGNTEPLTKDDWSAWHRDAVQRFSQEGLCIVKDGWVKLGRANWEDCVNAVESIAVVSHCNSQLDWFYCWFNMVDKIPKHIYYRLSQRSMLWPKLWKQLSKQKKLSEMIAAMPIYPLDDSPRFNVPSLCLPATGVLDYDFPMILSDFLRSQHLRTELTREIFDFHDTFVTKQLINLKKADDLLQGHRWKANGPFDDILFGWLDSHEPKDIWS